MKRLYLTIIAVLAALLAITSGGCKVGEALFDEAPTVDVTSVWLGSWVGENNSETGKLMLNLIQSDATLTGSIYLYNDLPSLANVGTDIEGKVSGSEVRFEMDSSDTNHHFTGTVEGSAIRDGVINYFNKKGTWTAEKLSTQALDIVATLTPPCNPWDLTFAGHSLLVCDISTSFIYKLDLNGNVLGSIDSECSFQNGVAAEGDTIFTSDGAARIFLISAADGKKKGQVSMPFDVQSFTIAPDIFFVEKFMTGDLHEVSRQGTLLHSFNIYRYSQAVAFDGESACLLYSIDAIVKYDRAGVPVQAYSIKLPEDKKWIISGSLAFDGECFWIVVGDYLATPYQNFLLRLRPK